MLWQLFFSNISNSTEITIDLSGGSYLPLTTYMPKSETKKQVKDTVVPQENFKVENIQDSKVWWLNITGENYKKVVERGTLFSPNYDGNHWSHKNQTKVKKGDILLIYSDLAIRSVGIAKSDNEVIGQDNAADIDFIKSCKTENSSADEYNKLSFYNFDLSIPIKKDDVELEERIKENQRFDKYSTFTKKGNAGYHHLSEIMLNSLIMYRVSFFLANTMPIWCKFCPSKQKFIRLLTDKPCFKYELWNNIIIGETFLFRGTTFKYW